MKTWIVCFCMLILGIAIGLAIAWKLLPVQIPMSFSNVGEVYIHPKTGDKIQWKYAGALKTVDFSKFGVTPCAEGLKTNTCTVSPQAKAGSYFYDCDGCPDPGIGMGSETGPQGGLGTTGAGMLPPPYAAPAGPKVWCKAGQAMVQPITGKAGQSFEFTPVAGTTFTATFQANTCTQGDTLNNGSPDCTLKNGATIPQSYSIQASVDRTACTNGTGMLNLAQ